MSIIDASYDFTGKNLLIITPSYPDKGDSYFGGTFVKNQVAELRKYFNKIIIIAPVLRSFGYLKNDRLCKDYSYDNVEVYYPRCYYIPIFWFSKILIDNRLEIVERTIEKYDLQFDLVHAHFTWPSGYIGIRLKERYGKPVVTTIHENGDWFDQEVAMGHKLINAAWKGADALIRVNKKDVPILQRYNGQVYSIPNGFSAAFYPMDTVVAREELALPKDKKIIFTLGNLIKRKGLNYLIDAMGEIGSRRNDVLCYIGGAGAERKNLQALIDGLHIEEKVRLLGSVPGEKLNLWMNACDIFVLSSLNEGNPTVMFEAFGCGKPFIGTKVGGVPEVITSDNYGLLVEPADPKDLAEKILMGLNRDWDRTKILSYAEGFTWEKNSKQTIAVFKQVLN